MKKVKNRQTATEIQKRYTFKAKLNRKFLAGGDNSISAEDEKLFLENMKNNSTFSMAGLNKKI